MANITTRRPLSASVPGEYTRKDGVHFPAPVTSTAIAQPVPPSFASSQQTVASVETVRLSFVLPAMNAGDTLTLASAAPAYFQSQGTVRMAPTDMGRFNLLHSPSPVVDGALIQGPQVTFNARGGAIGADGTLTPGTTYTQISLTGTIAVYAAGPVAAQSIAVPVTAQLLGSSVS